MNILIKRRPTAMAATEISALTWADATPEINQLMQQLFLSRDCTVSDDVNLALKNLLAPDQLCDFERATMRMVKAIMAQESILIVGDFDADGATATTLMVRVLRKMGARHVDYLIPNRFEDGYGLTIELLQRIEHAPPNLLITVDNGISSHDAVQYAKQHNIEVIITDHHVSSGALPEAYAVVNPNRPNDHFPSKALAGVGVAFYILVGVLRCLKAQHPKGHLDFNHINMADYLDLVAFGTIADVVKLDRNNRIMVEAGLKRIRQGKTCVGIQALAKVSKKNLATLTTGDIGFGLAPRLNVAGRLDDMRLGIECLLTDDPKLASQYASILDELNVERRVIEQSMLVDAEKYLHQFDDHQADAGAAIVVYDDLFHQGVIGIVASRLKEKFNRPTIVFAPVENGLIKGSGRSIAGFHLRDCLNMIDQISPGKILRFGGHAMAAGLTMKAESLPWFKQTFMTQLSTSLDSSLLQNYVLSDGALSESTLAIETAQLLKMAAPWGQGFPEPLFDQYFEVLDYQILKEVHIKFTLRALDHSQDYEAIAFFKAQSYQAHASQYLHCAYRLSLNEWKGQKKLQLIIEVCNPYVMA